MNWLSIHMLSCGSEQTLLVLNYSSWQWMHRSTPINLDFIMCTNMKSNVALNYRSGQISHGQKWFPSVLYQVWICDEKCFLPKAVVFSTVAYVALSLLTVVVHGKHFIENASEILPLSCLVPLYTAIPSSSLPGHTFVFLVVPSQ